MNNVDVETLSNGSFALRFVVIIGFCVVLGGMGYLLVLQDQGQQIQQAEQIQATLQDAFVQHQTDVAQLPAFRVQQSTLQSQLDHVLTPPTSQATMADVLVDISQTGLVAGVAFDLFQPQAVIQHPLYVEFPIQVRILGGFHALGTFISGLANRPRLITLHDMRIRQHVNNTDSKKPLILEATIKAYHGNQSQSLH